MTYKLPRKTEKLIEAKVESGRYASPTEVISEAVKLLDERDRLNKARRARFLQQIEEGLEDFRKGRRISGDQLFAELRERSKQWHENEKKLRSRATRSKRSA